MKHANQIVSLFSLALTALQLAMPMNVIAGEGVGNGAGEIAVRKLLESDPNRPVMQKIIEAFEIGHEPNPSEVQGHWMGYFVYQETSGQFNFSPYLLRVEYRDLGSLLGPMVLMATGRESTADFSWSSSSQISHSIREMMIGQLNRLEESQAKQDGAELVKRVWSQIYSKPNESGGSSALGGHGFHMTSRFKMFSGAMVGVLDSKEGSSCQDFTTFDGLNGWGIIARNVEGLKGHCGAWVFFKKLQNP